MYDAYTQTGGVDASVQVPTWPEKPESIETCSESEEECTEPVDAHVNIEQNNTVWVNRRTVVVQDNDDWVHRKRRKETPRLRIKRKLPKSIGNPQQPETKKRNFPWWC